MRKLLLAVVALVTVAGLYAVWSSDDGGIVVRPPDADA